MKKLIINHHQNYLMLQIFLQYYQYNITQNNDLITKLALGQFFESHHGV